MMKGFCKTLNFLFWTVKTSLVFRIGWFSKRLTGQKLVLKGYVGCLVFLDCWIWFLFQQVLDGLFTQK